MNKEEIKTFYCVFIYSTTKLFYKAHFLKIRHINSLNDWQKKHVSYSLKYLSNLPIPYVDLIKDRFFSSIK